MLGSDPIAFTIVPLLCLCGCIAVVLCAAGIWRRLRQDFPAGGFVESTRSWMTDQEARLEEIAQILTTSLSESTADAQNRLDEFHEAQTDISGRLARVEGDLSDLRILSDSFATQQDYAGLKDEIVAQDVETGSAFPHAEAFKAMEEQVNALGNKLVSIEEAINSLDSSGAGDGAQDAVDNLMRMTHIIKAEVAASHEQVKQVSERALDVQRSAARISEFETVLSGLATEVAECRSAIDSLSAEPLNSESRMEKRLQGNTKGNGKKKPKLISPEGRAKYREVTDLARQGKTPGDIALLTSLNIAEVELMVGGDSSSTKG